MERTRRAVIDVGTNSVKLLVADVAGSCIEPVWEESRQTRLGRGLYRTHRLQPEAIAAAAKAVSDFAGEARRRQAGSVRIIATSAARDALNAGDLTRAIEKGCGLDVQILSGEQEAAWGFQGVTTDPWLAERPLLLLDVGGGGTEFILGCRGQKHFSQSVALGTVRLLETLPPSDPPRPEELSACRNWIREFLEKEVRPQLEAPLQREAGDRSASGRFELVGTGGTATILACMERQLETFDRARIEGARLELRRMSWHLEHLWGLSLEKRQEVPGLPKNRADVILMGVAIFAGIMEQFGCPVLRISTRGLRFAALMHAPSAALG